MSTMNGNPVKEYNRHGIFQRGESKRTKKKQDNDSGDTDNFPVLLKGTDLVDQYVGCVS